MIRARHIFPWLVATGLLVFGGCGGATGEATESNAEITKLKSALEQAQQQKSQLQGDVERLAKSLNEAESRLAQTKEAAGELQQQVQDLTTSRDTLEKKVGDLDGRVNQLSTARGQLQQKVDELAKSRDDLQGMVASLTKARNAALEDAKVAQANVDLLNDKLKTQTQQMIELQEQITTIRSVLRQLQQKLE